MSLHGNLYKHQERLLQLLHACSRVRSLKATKPFHALTVTLGSVANQTIFVYNNIMSQYISLGELYVVQKVFNTMPQRNVVSYNTVIGAYSRCGFVEEAWKMFLDMRGCGFEPTQFTLVGLLSCESLDLCHGVQLQALAIKNGLFVVDAFVGTALLGLYGRQPSLEEAVWTFEDMPYKSLVTWNLMISLFGRHGFVEDTIFMFRELMKTRASLSELSFVAVLCGFSCKQDLEFGEQIHGLVMKIGFMHEVTLGYRPNEYSFSAVLKSSLALELRQLHCLVIRMGFENNDFVLSSLITSYAKNGLISDALVFVTTSDHPLSVPEVFASAVENPAAVLSDELSVRLSGKSHVGNEASALRKVIDGRPNKSRSNRMQADEGEGNKHLKSNSQGVESVEDNTTSCSSLDELSSDSEESNDFWKSFVQSS
ncbi:hypothetical protein FEM48_Zijuj06G0176300 [Ziziphus jujuba var. spinosa]|uniref:Pentatricopeptide repeat-containing protein n=1 Tax=Ziziphus jujuba var. spinosa TaxID=714518 RepID=A0A978VAP1_ZIZJJ|nr:hypothetical protein FEM48_Zijuj06G0176300 [Ziziphus jujuba var. spinosa]